MSNFLLVCALCTCACALAEPLFRVSSAEDVVKRGRVRELLGKRSDDIQLIDEYRAKRRANELFGKRSQYFDTPKRRGRELFGKRSDPSVAVMPMVELEPTIIQRDDYQPEMDSEEILNRVALMIRQRRGRGRELFG